MNQPVYITTEQKKHRAFILAVDADYFDNQLIWRNGSAASAFGWPINMFPHELFLQSVQSDLVIREREYLDNGVTTHESRRGADGKFKKGNPRYKQVLPYLVPRQKQADGSTLIFPYRRTSGVGEARLAGNGSCGFGGHVDLVDIVMEMVPVNPNANPDDLTESAVVANSVIDLPKTIMGSLLRECGEEFTVYDANGVEVPVDPSWLSFADLFILDNSNAVGELHLGVVMHLDIPEGYTLKATEDELAHVEPATAELLLNDNGFNPENWTRIYLEHVVKMAEFGAKYSIDHGGEKVGEVDTHFIAADLQALETGATDPTDGFKEIPPPMGDCIPASHWKIEKIAALPVEDISKPGDWDFVNMNADQLLAFTDEHILAMSHTQIAGYRAALVGQVNGALASWREDQPSDEQKSTMVARLDKFTAQAE